MQIQLNADLRQYHTFSLSQHCEVLVEITSIEELIEVYSKPEWSHLPKLILGKGSNVLFTQFYAGVVVINHLLGIDIKEVGNTVSLHVMGGEDWPSLVKMTVENKWCGLENLALIPGCAGSAPIQNIGAYGVEFNDICDYVEFLDLETMTIQRLTQAECQFGYRDSIFKNELYAKVVITAVGLKLSHIWSPKLGYGPLQSLDNKSSLQDVYDIICQTRMEKLPDPKEIGNAGSFFKNPLISHEHHQSLLQQFPNLVAYPAGESMKVAAGWLIDQCGLKGLKIGGAQVHPQQALVLTNIDGATIDDVLSLAKQVVDKVNDRYYITLEHEVRFIGRDGETQLSEVLV
ncbi:UDP-N-acetylmuramate dehydrogenase [Vibrio sp. WJH972]